MIKNDWFSDWFNTPFYHILYANRNFDEAEKFITKLVAELGIDKADQVLDAACGKGRHSITLNNLGYSVKGVDLSQENINEAKTFENPTLSFDVADIRFLPYTNQFGLVVNLFTSFGYFDTEEEDLLAVQSFSKALIRGGLLVIDYLNPDYVINQLVENEEIERGEIVFKINRIVEGEFVYKHIRFTYNENDFHFTERVKLIKEDTFRKLLRWSNFDWLNIKGDYELNDFNPQVSPRMIIFAQKI